MGSKEGMREEERERSGREGKGRKEGWHNSNKYIRRYVCTYMYLDANKVESKLLGHSSSDECLTCARGPIEQDTTPLLDGTLLEQGWVLGRRRRRRRRRSSENTHMHTYAANE